MPPIKTRISQTLAVTGASAQFANAMESGQQYRFTANTDCWVKVSDTGDSAVAAAADNHLYIKGQTLWLAIGQGETVDGFVHVIRDTADGSASLSLYEGL